MKKLTFDYIPQGAVINESVKGNYFIYSDKKWDSSKTVIVDTGNKLKQGIIDHHQPGSENASVALIIANDAHKYLNHLRAQDEITIVTHFNPDLDAIASCYLVQKFLNDGVLSDTDRLFATYVNEVDSGKLTIDPRYPFTVASVINAINDEFKDIDSSKKSHNILDEGLRFIEEVYSLLETDQNLWGDHFLDNMKGFDTYRIKIHKDVEEYYKDFEERSETDTLYLLNTETNVYEQVDFILTKNPNSVLWKYWVRGDTLNSPKGNGFIFTCALYDENEGRKRAIIATDPTTPYNLKGLGILLDSIEINELIRDGSTNEKLVGEPRVGFCRNNPWYDGSGAHKFTIVDAPRGNSTLTGDKIISTIKANELWLKIGEDIHEGRFDRLNFDAVKELPHPLSYEKVDEKSIYVFEKADLEEKQNHIADLKSATEKLLHLTPASEFEKLKRDSLRNRLFQSLVQYYIALPPKLKHTAASEITDLLIDTFPPNYLQNWVLHTNKLPVEPLRKTLERALPFVAPKERFMFLMHVRDRHNVATLSLEQNKQIDGSNPDVFQSIIEFYNTFDIPFTLPEEFEETPLFLLHNGILHFEDILINIFLSDEHSKDVFPQQLSVKIDNITDEEVAHFRQKLKETLDTHIILRWFGENYKNLRDSRNRLLNAGIAQGLDQVKRYSISRIIELRYSELKELINMMFSGIDLNREEVNTYREQLLFLKSNRRFEFLIDRYYVFLRLRVLLQHLDSGRAIPVFLKDTPDFIPLLHLFDYMYHTSTAFMWHDDKKQTGVEIKRIMEQLIRLKSLNLPIEGIYSLLDGLYTFYSHMLEELDIDVSQTGKKVELCLNQHESLRNDGHLLSTISSLPVYFRHILYEVLLSYRRHYQDKIHYLQNELQYVVETDSTSADDNNLYVDFCNDILLRSMEHDWKDHRLKVMQEDDLGLKQIFFKKYFYWHSVTFGSYTEKREDQKREITKLNSAIRFAAGKDNKSIKKIVNSLPNPEGQSNLNDHLNLLIYRKDFVAEASFVPLNLYYDTYDYLSERYIETFDIENVAKSISSFSTKFPAYIRWFSNTNFLRACVLAFVALLFLMGAFDPNIYEFNGETYRPPLPEIILFQLGDRLFNVISGALVAFWTTFVGIAFMVPVVIVLYKILLNSYKKLKTGEANTLSFIKNIERIEGKQSRLLYLAFIIPLVLIVIQMAKPGTLSMISEFEGLRLLSSIVIIFMLTVYSIYIDVEQKNPKKPPSWLTSRTKHMFWLYSLQALVLTVFVIDFLLRFQLSADNFSTPEDLISVGISRYIVLEFKWFDIVLMPLFTIIISFLTLFFTFFVNRIFKR